MSTPQPTIHLLGDAILDNFFWLSNKELDLTKEVELLGYKVYNHAIDTATVKDIITGIVPDTTFTKSRSYPYPIDNNGKIVPLKALGQVQSFSNIYSGIQSFNTNSSANKMVVISLGGNDVKRHICNIILGADYFINSVITPDFIKDYQTIIKSVISSCEKVILCTIYLPYLGSGSSYGNYSLLAKPVMVKWNTFIFEFGKKHNIPVLDLSRTFNAYDRSHYGTIDYYPSNVSSHCMSHCISHIYKHYDGHHIYYATNCDYSHIFTE